MNLTAVLRMGDIGIWILTVVRETFRAAQCTYIVVNTSGTDVMIFLHKYFRQKIRRKNWRF
jgi:hypothetical protein